MPRTSKTIHCFFRYKEQKYRLKAKRVKTLNKNEIRMNFMNWLRSKRGLLRSGQNPPPIFGCIGESLVARHGGYKRISSRKGDMYDPILKVTRETKSCTSDSPSSFSTKSMCEYLDFVDIQDDGNYFIYEFTREEFENFLVRKDLTLIELQEFNSNSDNPGVRGRLGLREVVEEMKKTPKYSGNIFK
jgi:hypothetical protein